eukprot:178958_1
MIMAERGSQILSLIGVGSDDEVSDDETTRNFVPEKVKHISNNVNLNGGSSQTSILVDYGHDDSDDGDQASRNRSDILRHILSHSRMSEFDTQPTLSTAHAKDDRDFGSSKSNSDFTKPSPEVSNSVQDGINGASHDTIQVSTSSSPTGSQSATSKSPPEPSNTKSYSFLNTDSDSEPVKPPAFSNSFMPRQLLPGYKKPVKHIVKKPSKIVSEPDHSKENGSPATNGSTVLHQNSIAPIPTPIPESAEPSPEEVVSTYSSPPASETINGGSSVMNSDASLQSPFKSSCEHEEVPMDISESDDSSSESDATQHILDGNGYFPGRYCDLDAIHITSPNSTPSKKVQRTSDHLQKLLAIFEKKKSTYNENLRAQKSFRNPNILTRIVQQYKIKDHGTNYPKPLLSLDPSIIKHTDKFKVIDVFQATWTKAQRSNRTKVEFTQGKVVNPGAVQSTKRRRTKWDQPRQQRIQRTASTAAAVQQPPLAMSANRTRASISAVPTGSVLSGAAAERAQANALEKARAQARIFHDRLLAQKQMGAPPGALSANAPPSQRFMHIAAKRTGGLLDSLPDAKKSKR